MPLASTRGFVANALRSVGGARCWCSATEPRTTWAWAARAVASEVSCPDSFACFFQFDAPYSALSVSTFFRQMLRFLFVCESKKKKSPREHASSIVAWKALRLKTDILMNGSPVKNHISFKSGLG